MGFFAMPAEEYNLFDSATISCSPGSTNKAQLLSTTSIVLTLPDSYWVSSVLAEGSQNTSTAGSPDR